MALTRNLKGTTLARVERDPSVLYIPFSEVTRMRGQTCKTLR